MFHVDNPTGVPVMPPVAAELSKTTLYFTEGGNGIPPTYPGPDWFNIIQSELLEILRQANITPDKNTTDQIMTALKKLFISNSGSAGAIAGLTGQENTFPYFTGEDTMALTPLSAFIRGILGKSDASEVILALGLNAIINKANNAVQRSGDTMQGSLTLQDLSTRGTVNSAGGVYDKGHRVYSPDNPPPAQSLPSYATQEWVLQNTIQNIDHTAPIEVQFNDAGGYPRGTDGAAMYNLQMVGGASNVGWIQYRYMRKQVNGTWLIINN